MIVIDLTTFDENDEAVSIESVPVVVIESAEQLEAILDAAING